METAYDKSNKQIAWDATSLTSFITCPRLYYYKNVLGWRPNSESVHLTFGTLAHSTRESYDHAKAAGADHEEAILAAIKFVLIASKDFTSTDSYKNRKTLLRTMVWYLETHKNDALQTVILANGKPAVELSFRFELDSSTMLCGHIDKLVSLQDQVWVADLKTSKAALGTNYFNQYTPSIQMPLYTVAGKVVYNTQARGVIIDAAQILVTGNRYQRAPIPYAEDWLEEYLKTIKHWINLASAYHEAEFWPMNNTACQKFNGCEFQKVCSRTPDVREMFLKADFHINRWDPLITRGGSE